LRAEGQGTRITLTHRAFGTIPPDVFEGAGAGWAHILERIRAIAERLAK
jgi:hypothetical protein